MTEGGVGGVCESLGRRRPVTQVEVASFDRCSLLFSSLQALAHLQVTVPSSVRRKARCLAWRVGISKGTPCQGP